MTEGHPSSTARRVAAYRLTFERLPTAFGNPDADELLARDVTAGEAADPLGGMARYLRGRTAFFDRVVINALERQVAQVISVGAGYDGRAWRYANDGVRWWEVDQPDTQRDKQARLARLGIEIGQVTFVAHNLYDEGLAAQLLAAGFEPDAPSLIIAEGVAVYLEPSPFEGALSELRSLATVGTRLAMSLGASPSSPSHAARRARLEATLDSMGEPARNSIKAAEAGPLLSAAGWRSTAISARATQAGFVVAAPEWSPASGSRSPTRGDVGLFMERMLYRAGTDSLGDHLEATYGVAVTGIRELDLGVHRVDRADGTRWVARVFPASRPAASVREDARALDWLAASGVPAERGADPRPVSEHAGQAVLVTTFVAGPKAPATTEVFATLGTILGRLHVLTPKPGTPPRPGGAWHHLALDVGPAGELAAARSLFAAAGMRVGLAARRDYDALGEDLARLESFEDLPHAFGHPDLVPRNLICPGATDYVVVDWTGAGWAPRVLTLGCLLWSTSGNASHVRAALTGYRTLIAPSASEIDRIEIAMWTRPLLLACWNFALGRAPLADMAVWWQAQRTKIQRSAKHARSVLAGP